MVFAKGKKAVLLWDVFSRSRYHFLLCSYVGGFFSNISKKGKISSGLGRNVCGLHSYIDTTIQGWNETKSVNLLLMPFLKAPFYAHVCYCTQSENGVDPMIPQNLSRKEILVDVFQNKNGRFCRHRIWENVDLLSKFCQSLFSNNWCLSICLAKSMLHGPLTSL